MMINLANRFVILVYFLMILFNSPSSSFMMPGNSMDTDPCMTCRKISDKFIEVYCLKLLMNKTYFLSSFFRLIKKQLEVTLEGKNYQVFFIVLLF